MKGAPVVALLSDFGNQDWYAGVIKAVVLSRCPSASLIDLTHEIPPQDIAAGAIVLRAVLPWLPKRTVVLAVVDPGVGTSRALLAAEADGRFLVGPDNGLLALALAQTRKKRVVRLTQKRYWQKTISKTFHGRDILAPVAAHLAAGGRLNALGPVQRRIQPLAPVQDECNRKPGRGWVVYIDRFGNCITDLPSAALRGIEHLRVGHRRARVVRAYAEGKAKELIALAGSTGLVELALNQGNAAKRLKVSKGVIVEIERVGRLASRAPQ